MCQPLNLNEASAIEGKPLLMYQSKTIYIHLVEYVFHIHTCRVLENMQLTNGKQHAQEP